MASFVPELAAARGLFRAQNSRPRSAFTVAVRLWDARVPDAERYQAVANVDTAYEAQSRRPQRHRDREKT